MDRFTKRDGQYGISRVCHYESELCGEALCYNCIKRTQCNADIFERLAAFEYAADNKEKHFSLMANLNPLYENGFLISRDDEPKRYLVEMYDDELLRLKDKIELVLKHKGALTDGS